MVDPPGIPKASLHTNDDLTSDAKAWLEGSDVGDDTRWTDLGMWLDEAAARSVRRPRRSGRTA